MKLKQLSVFLENKPGQLSIPCKALAAAGINIATLSLADTQEFGILRLIVGDVEKAKQVLEAEDCVVNVCEVLAVEVPDHPGGLTAILAAIEGEAINLEYMYAFSCWSQNRALLIFRFDDPDKAIAALQKRSINVVDRLEIFGATS